MSDKVERPNTLFVAVPDELLAESNAVIVDKLIGSLGLENVRCIQFVPNHFVRITFASFEARNAAFLSGVYAGSIRLSVTEADPVFTDVRLVHLPIEVPDDAVREALGRFGAIHQIVHLKYAGSSVYTGTRSVKMSLALDIPVNFRILRYPCRICYQNQPRPCTICRSPDHHASDCPLRDVCRRCHKPGHFARDCLDAVPVPSDPVPSAADDYTAPDADVDADVASDDDSIPSDDELASGDEKVLRSAPAPSDSPIRTRASKRVSGELPCVSKRPRDVSSPDGNAKAESTVSSVPSPISVSPPDESASSFEPDPPDIVALFLSTYSQFALLFKDADGFSALDLHHMTRRCIREDNATPEMYHNIYYSEKHDKDFLPSMFPTGRPPLPADITLSPKIAPASFPASC